LKHFKKFEFVTSTRHFFDNKSGTVLEEEDLTISTMKT
jgi:hypothetical protein